MAIGVPAPPDDKLLQTTCEKIALTVEHAIAAEPAGTVRGVHIPDGPQVGRQLTIDATEEKGLTNRCRLSFLDPSVAPAGEVVRIEYEHDKEGKYGVHRVYSVQSVRRRGRELVLLENFMAEDSQTTREEDFRPILSESYAQETVLKSVQDWTKFRAWQRQQGKK
jgi:hypothetical protein